MLIHRCIAVLTLVFTASLFASPGWGEDGHVAFIVQPATEACPIDNIAPTPGPDQPRQYACEGLIYTVSVPAGCENGGCGLILDQHGVLMNAENQNDGTRMRTYGWNAKERGALSPYIVIQPNLGQYYAGGTYYPGDFSKEKVLRFVKAAANAWRVDRGRIHADGFSQGTQDMVYKLLCEDSDFFASYALIASIFAPLTCDPPKNPLLEIVGAYDVNYYALGVIGQNRDLYLSQMGAYTTEKLHSDPLWWLYGSGKYQHMRYRGSGYWYEHLVHSGVGGGLEFITLGFDGGHCLPCGRKPTNAMHEVTCFKADFEIGAKIIDFFIAHPK